MASRRAADELIASGGVRVKGKTPPPEGVLIDPDHDRITVHGKAVKPVTRHRYIVLNKPLGVITTARDEGARTTVLDVVGDEGKSGHRLFPVGRLDADTSGLLLLTDDGDLAYRLTHPGYKVSKEYIALVAGNPTSADIESLRTGVKLDDGMTAPAEVDVLRITPGSRDSVPKQGEAMNHMINLDEVDFVDFQLQPEDAGGVAHRGDVPVIARKLAGRRLSRCARLSSLSSVSRWKRCRIRWTIRGRGRWSVGSWPSAGLCRRRWPQ